MSPYGIEERPKAMRQRTRGLCQNPVGLGDGKLLARSPIAGKGDRVFVGWREAAAFMLFRVLSSDSNPRGRLLPELHERLAPGFPHWQRFGSPLLIWDLCALTGACRCLDCRRTFYLGVGGSRGDANVNIFNCKTGGDEGDASAPEENPACRLFREYTNACDKLKNADD
jgi:hypothetical protein